MKNCFSELLLTSRRVYQELNLDIHKKSLSVPGDVRSMWERNLVTISNSREVPGEGREGRFYNQGEHASREMEDDVFSSILHFLSYQRLVRGGLGLQLVKEVASLASLHRRFVEGAGETLGGELGGWLGGSPGSLSSPLPDLGDMSRGETR